MEIDIELNTDNGFLRRECPRCEQEFKWFHGKTENRPAEFVDPDLYFCPYCGEPSPPDEYWTQAQLDYTTAVAAAAAQGLMADEVKKLERKGSLFSITVDLPATEAAPSPPAEPEDMIGVEPPCHPFEPVKVMEGWDGPLHCIVCGQRYIVGD